MASRGESGDNVATPRSRKAELYGHPCFESRPCCVRFGRSHGRLRRLVRPCGIRRGYLAATGSERHVLTLDPDVADVGEE